MLSVVGSWKYSLGLGLQFSHPRLCPPIFLGFCESVLFCSLVLTCWILVWHQDLDLTDFSAGFPPLSRFAWFSSSDFLSSHRHSAFTLQNVSGGVYPLLAAGLTSPVFTLLSNHPQTAATVTALLLAGDCRPHPPSVDNVDQNMDVLSLLFTDPVSQVDMAQSSLPSTPLNYHDLKS